MDPRASERRNSIGEPLLRGPFLPIHADLIECNHDAVVDDGQVGADKGWDSRTSNSALPRVWEKRTA